MNPLPDGQGKIFITPLNMVQAGQTTVPSTTPAPDSGPAGEPKDGENPPADAIGTKSQRQLAELLRLAPRLVKTVERDEDGRITRVIEEPMTTTNGAH